MNVPQNKTEVLNCEDIVGYIYNLIKQTDIVTS